MSAESTNHKIAAYRREIYWPVLGAVFFVLIGIVIILLMQRRVQVSLVADWMLTTIVLLPMLVCTFAVCIGLLAMIVVVGRFNRGIEQALRQGGDLSEQAAKRSVSILTAVDATTVRIMSWLGVANKFLNLFEIEERRDRGGEHNE